MIILSSLIVTVAFLIIWLPFGGFSYLIAYLSQAGNTHPDRDNACINISAMSEEEDHEPEPEHALYTHVLAYTHAYTHTYASMHAYMLMLPRSSQRSLRRLGSALGVRMLKLKRTKKKKQPKHLNNAHVHIASSRRPKREKNVGVICQS